MTHSTSNWDVKSSLVAVGSLLPVWIWTQLEEERAPHRARGLFSLIPLCLYRRDERKYLQNTSGDEEAEASSSGRW